MRVCFIVLKQHTNTCHQMPLKIRLTDVCLHVPLHWKAFSSFLCAALMILDQQPSYDLDERPAHCAPSPAGQPQLGAGGSERGGGARGARHPRT